VGFTFVTCSIAALAGIPERDAGLASGLSNTSFQIGAAVGTAIVSTAAVSRSSDVIASGGDALGALVASHQAGFLAAVVLAGVALLAALLLLRRPAGPASDNPPLVPVGERVGD
jgi:hypothetical protein